MFPVTVSLLASDVAPTAELFPRLQEGLTYPKYERSHKRFAAPPLDQSTSIENGIAS